MISVGKGMEREHTHPTLLPQGGDEEGQSFPDPFLTPSPPFSPASVSNASGNLIMQEVAIRPLTQDMLLHEVCHTWDV